MVASVFPNLCSIIRVISPSHERSFAIFAAQDDRASAAAIAPSSL